MLALNHVGNLEDWFGPTQFRLCAIFLGIAITLLVLLHLHLNYLVFLALGPGGTPATYGGFCRVTALSLVKVRDPYKPNACANTQLRDRHGFLQCIPRRLGERPVIMGIAPHRQRTQRANQRLYTQLRRRIGRLGLEHAGTLAIGTSCFEQHSTGLFAIEPAAATCNGEICHAHPVDGSIHLTLHCCDAQIVLDAGWGERHPLAHGGWFERFVPAGFVMVYAPRDEAELKVVMKIVRAAAWFVLGGGGEQSDI